jgi:FSR family fosmidomycin resistance protein-like MFS transporter
MNYKIIFLLFAGHLMTDISQGMVPALLPYFISEYKLTYSAAGFLVMALTISSTIVQPLFGFLADRKPLPWFIALGPFLAGLGIAIAGLFHQYYLIVLGIFICGLGVAAFHPEGARIAGIASGERKASGMSLYSVGGNAGFAMGPLIVTGLILLGGLKGITFYFIPALLLAIILYRVVGRFCQFSPGVSQGGNDSGQVGTKKIDMEDAWVPFILLTLAIICRSILFQGINTFLPSYWIEFFKASKEHASTSLTILLGMGVVGNLVGGRLADRFGNLKTVSGAFLLLIPQLLIFVRVTDVTLATLLLMTIGFTCYLTFSPMIVMGQQYLPGRVGFASGITIGVAVSFGGFAAPLLGRIADAAGVQAVFSLIVVFPLIAALLLAFVPKALHR